METNNSNATATGTPEATVLTVDQVVEQVRAITANLPEYDVQVPANRRSQLMRVNDRFVASVASAISNLPEVQQILGSTAEDLRTSADESLRWMPAIDAARGLLAMLEAADLQRRQRTGLKALQAYSICQQLVRDGSHAARLGTHVDEMKRLSNFKRKSTAATTPTPAPGQPQQQVM